MTKPRPGMMKEPSKDYVTGTHSFLSVGTAGRQTEHLTLVLSTAKAHGRESANDLLVNEGMDWKRNLK